MAEKSPSCSLEEENQTAKMPRISVSSADEAPETIIQTSALFSPGIHDGLIKMLNQLDPDSFVKFSRTCKDMYDFCYNTKGIQVQFPCTIYAEFGTSFHKIGVTGEDGRAISEQELQMLPKMPFIFVVKKIYCFEEMDARILEEVRQMLSRFPRVFVEFVSCFANVLLDWNDFIQLLQDYKVKSADISSLSNEIPDDILSFFLTKLDRFWYDGHVADDLILSATAKELHIWSIRISKSTFVHLLRKFVNEDIVEWDIGRERHFVANAASDPFIEACSEAMRVVKKEEIDWEKMEPSVLYNRLRDPRTFHVRKSDGLIGRFTIAEDLVFFRIGL